MPTLSALPILSIHHLVLASSTLAGLQLIKVPSTDLHVAVVLIQTLREGHGLVSTPIRASRVLVSLLSLSLDRLLLCRCSRAATEEATDGVADGGADSDTTVKIVLAGARIQKYIACCWWRNSRSGASHLAEKTGTCALLRRCLGLLRWVCGGGSRAVLRLCRWRYGSLRDSRARWC